MLEYQGTQQNEKADHLAMKGSGPYIQRSSINEEATTNEQKENKRSNRPTYEPLPRQRSPHDRSGEIYHMRSLL